MTGPTPATTMSRPDPAAGVRQVRLGTQLAWAALIGLMVCSGITLLAVLALNFEATQKLAEIYPGPTVAAVSGNLLSWSIVGVLFGLVAALILSPLVMRRMTRSFVASFESMAQVSEQMAAGNYTVRVADPDLGPEVGALVSSFNGMAAKLDETEAARRRMLTDLAHEMRTPIASMDMLLEGIEDGVVVPDQDTIDLFRQQTRRLRRLSEDVREVSAAEEGRLNLSLTRCDLRDVASGVPVLYADRLRDKQVELTIEASADEPVPVLIDVDRIHQVLTNLLNNALRHTAPGGHVSIVIDHTDVLGRLEVIDDGEGISPEHLTKVTERFFRVDTARSRAEGGTGVGLSICRAIAAHHGGSLLISSPGLGLGTTGTLLLPLATD